MIPRHPTEIAAITWPVTTSRSALPAALLARRPALLPVLLRGGWVVGVLVAAASLFLPTGEARQFGLFYLAPLIPAVALWARERLAAGADYSRTALLLDGSVFVLAGLRTLTGVPPYSGHMLFLTHALLTARSTALRVFVGLLWLETGYFKLVVWDDPVTWSVGLVLGAGFGLAYRSRA